MEALPAVPFALSLLLMAGCATAFSAGAPGAATHAPDRVPPTEPEVASLFDRWNQSLQSGDPWKVVANYAERSILLPTVSGKPRLTPVEKADYFQHFLENRPSGRIDLRQITISGTMAVDTGHYTFHYAKTGTTVGARYSFTYRWDGTQWLIVSHHSSVVPER